MKTVYFDHAATTPVDKRVLDKMLPYFTTQFGNANSAHQFGRDCKVAIEDAREEIAGILGAEPSEIIFTSGGTESDNAIIKGVVNATRKKEVVTSPIEHHAVIHPAEFLKMTGSRVTYLTPDSQGEISPEELDKTISEDTAVVSLMHVNNEIGTINPIQELAEVCKKKNVPFHTDAVQSVGKLPINVNELGVDALSVSAHKIYGPKGIGLLYVKNGTPWIPWLQGGSQERRRRGGTTNVAGVVGMAEALRISVKEQEEATKHYKTLRETAIGELNKRFGDLYQINGPAENGMPNILNIGFKTAVDGGLDGEMLLLNLDIDGICVSNGSACTSGAMEPSHVLEGIGVSNAIANSSIRISFGKQNSVEEVHYFADKLEQILQRMMKTTA